ncbi:hypothetical protein K1T71_007987 [Dendrolimus kikuchii]|uniref:Uncharacterized protein n=1 Tax=Dendrolimus kikuchii TaxID=765133 RepID=A0ACC1CYT3_9NEOP|nr:hypothetical protein K1T71_007987 [Dendrolimus kikuchii]
MNGHTDICSSMELSCSTKVNNLERSLQKTLIDFKELKTDLDRICIDSENYKSQFLTQKEKCESKNCSSAELLNKIIEDKNKKIQFIESSLTKLNQTRNFAIVEDIFKILYQQNDIVTTPENNKDEPGIKIEKQTPEKVNESIAEDVSFNDSGNGIEDTPAGRTSPIIQPKKIKSKENDVSSDYRDKKKCPDSWPTPEKKSLKLLYPTPAKGKGSGKMRQMRLSYAKIKQTSVVDLTCSPEFAGGLRCTKSVTSGNLESLLIKKESVESDDTIMPSPTSGPTNFTLFKSATKDSPVKFRKPLSLKAKKEKENDRRLEIPPAKSEPPTEETICLEDNLHKKVPERVIGELKKGSPAKVKKIVDNDATCCENSMSILQCSPSKRPLVENINVENVRLNEDMEASISLLRPEFKAIKTAEVDDVKRKIAEFEGEPLYKEPAVRKKSEKRALPGWICEECKNFYGVLYEDNPLMLAKMVEECSKHRGRRNPARPKTPPNFWNPRWDVPEDTEELNRMNNAV